MALTAGLLVGAVIGTNAGLPTVARLQPVAFQVTSALSGGIVDFADPSSEVRDLRGRITQHGLSRQEIASAIGVDRRSLSGYASGEIRPAPERLEMLRVLAELVESISSIRPGRAREVLFSRRAGRSLVDELALSGRDILLTWRSSMARNDAMVTVSRRPPVHEPIWTAAARAFIDGRLVMPSRSRTVRPASVYEANPDEAAAFAERPYVSRRRGYR